MWLKMVQWGNDAIEEMKNISFYEKIDNKNLDRETLIIIKLYYKSTLYMFMLDDKVEQEESQNSMYCHGNTSNAYFLKVTN